VIYAQISAGLKLHLAYQPGEGKDDAHIVRSGYLSAPLCGTDRFAGSYRMTINLPLGNACKRCSAVARARGHF
jgi:hypothetical protein